MPDGLKSSAEVCGGIENSADKRTLQRLPNLSDQSNQLFVDIVRSIPAGSAYF